MRAMAWEASATWPLAWSPPSAIASATQDWMWSSSMVSPKDCSALVVAPTWVRTSVY